MRRVIPAALVLLAACTDSLEQPTADPVPSSSPAVVRASPTPASSAAQAAQAVEIAGEYRIAGVNGRDINQPYGITASIGADRIHITADCLNFAWSYRQQGSVIATKRVAVEGCGRGPTAAEEAIVAAFDAAASVVRTPANALEFRAPGHTVTLFSQ